MGEGLPFSMWRVDNANAWIPNRNHYPAKKKIGEYFQNNFHITVSGNFALPGAAQRADGDAAPTASCSRPTGRSRTSTTPRLWFDAAPIGEEDRLKIGRTNALKLFKLKGA